MKMNRSGLVVTNITLAATIMNFLAIPTYGNNPLPSQVRIEPTSKSRIEIAENKPAVAAAQTVVHPMNKPATVTDLGDMVRPDSPSLREEKKIASVAPSLTPKTAEMDTSIILRAGLKNSREDIDLTVNKSEIIDLKVPVSRVAISESEIAKVVVINPTQIQLLGKKIGVANLTIWPNAGSNEYTTIDIVVHRDVSALAKQLQIIDPNIRVVPLAAEDSVILTGEVNSMDSSQLAAQLAKAFFASGANSQAMGASNTKNIMTDSQTPGSSVPSPMPNVINLIQVKGRPSTKLELARTKLRDIDPNISLDILPGPDGAEKAVLTGRVASASVISEAINTASIFYGQPGMKVVTGPGGNLIRPTGGATFQTANAFSDNQDVNVLQGSVMTDATGNVISMMKLARKPQIKCTIKFLDISRRDVNQLGATLTGQNGDMGYGHFSGAQSALRPFSNLKGTIGDSETGSGWLNGTGGAKAGVNALAQLFDAGTTQVFTINQNMAVALSTFLEKRKVRSLAEPTLTMLSGEKASFLAGGELPIPVTGNNGQITITYKEFGIRLNIIPTVTEDGKINMQVAPEVSAIDPSNAITANGISVPAIRSRRMQTTLEVKDNQPFILAGLFNEEEIDAVSRFPGLGDIPVLGAFFRQKNKDRLKNEMLVIITPQVVYEPSEMALSPAAKQAIEISEKVRAQGAK